MKIRDIIVEYSHEITQQRLGQPVLDRFAKESTDWQRRVLGQAYNMLMSKENTHNLIDHLIRLLEATDPTPNKEYVPWLARTYIRDPHMRFEDVTSIIGDFLAKFHKLKQRRQLPSPRNDINRYSNFGDFMSVMDEYDDPDAKPLTDKGQADEIYNDEVMRVIVPKDQTAACYYGQGTRWCTAATKGINRFREYSPLSPLMIVLPKKPAYPGEKYQLWFYYGSEDRPIESDDDYLDLYHEYGEGYMIDNMVSGQFMDEKDHEISLKKLVSRFGASLNNAIQALEKQYPKISYAVKQNFKDDIFR